MDKKVTKIKMIDNFVRKYELDLANRMPTNDVAKYSANVGFSIKNIVDGENNDYVGQIMLTNKLDITSERTTGTIYIEMEGLFSAPKSLDKDEFERQLKVEGATTLSHYMRTYIHAVTALSNMPIVNTPIIDFEEFFNNADKKKNFKLITNESNNIEE